MKRLPLTLLIPLGVMLSPSLAGYFWHRYHTSEAYRKRGYALQAADHYRAAVPLFQEVVRQQPNSASAHYDLGLAWMAVNYRNEERWAMIGGKST